jgi:hypothetical protein
MIGMPNINQYFKVAMSYPVAKLQAVMRGQDQSIPMLAAMAAFEIKGPMEIAAKAQQALAKKSTVNVREKLAQEGQEEQNGMMPDNLMMAMQQQQQGSLPENTGIGQLPAPNMQTMSAANGGIIAFDDGGYVPGYAEGDLIGDEYVSDRPPMSYGEQMGNVGDLMFRGVKRLFNAPLTEDEKEAERKRKKEDKSKPYPVSKAKRAATEFKPYPADAKPRAVNPTAGQAVTDANANPGYVPPSTSSAPVARDTVPAPKEKRTGIAAITPQTGRPSGKSDLDAALEASAKLGGSAEQDYKAKLANYGSEATAVMNKLALEREQGKPTGQAYSGLEASLKKDEEAAAGKEKRNLQMALVNAGLAIAGGTSRYAMENIGKGALVGTKQYMDGVDKLEAAAKERQKAMAMIEQERRAEARGDWKDKNEFAAKRAEFELNAKKFGVEGVGKIFELGKRSATDLYNTMSTNASRERIGQEQNKTELLKADKMVAAYGQRGGGEYNVLADNARARYTEWAKSAAGQIALMKNPSLENSKYLEFLRAEYINKGLPPPGGLTGGATMPGGGPVKFLGFEKQ